MNGTDSQKAIQPCIQIDDSFAADQSFTQPDRQSMVENANYYHLFNLVNNDKMIETPKSNHHMNALNDNGLPDDVESNRSSVLFERSQTHREKGQSETKSNNKEDIIKITTLKTLLRLFRVNLVRICLESQFIQMENDTFEFNGQRFMIDLDESYCSGTTPTNHKTIYNQQDTKTMPRQEENYFSPVKYSYNEARQQPNQNTRSAVGVIVNPIEQLNMQSASSTHAEFKDIHLFQTSNIKDDYIDLLNIQSPNLDNNQITSKQVSFQKSVTFDKEIQVDEKILTLDVQNIINAVKVEEQTLIVEEVKEVEVQQPTQQQEVDNFYADIARQLALEIELEELEEELKNEEQDDKMKKEQEEKERKDKEQKDYQASLQQHQGGHHKIKSELIEPSKNTTKLSSNFVTGSSPLIDNRDSIVQSIESAENPKLKRFMSLGDSRDYRFNKNAQLHQMSSRNQELQEQLNAAKQQLESIGQIFIGKNGDRNIADAPLHLAFLFASPLVMRQSGNKGQNFQDNFSTVPLLEFGKEFKEVRESLAETKRVIRYRAKQATIGNLSLILSQNPLALHFSGHGLENSKENFGRQHKQRQNDGNYLLFETEDGEGELVSEKMLQEFIQSSNTNLEFVFVASCYSEFAGKIFLNAGANHVICVRSGEQIADQAVITFSKSFYNSVFSQTMTICDAFKMAQKQVQVKFGLQESNKFSILINDSNSPVQSKVKVNQLFSPNSSNTEQSSCNHKCKVFGPLKQGDSEYLEVKSKFREYPAKVDNFIGRQKEMFEVVHNVYNHRLVTIIGLPGIGKTSLSKNAIHYIVDRKIFKQGVVFMQLKGCISFEVFMKNLIVNIAMQNFDLDQDKKKEFLESNPDQVFSLALNYLKNQEDNLLLVFDNVEDLLSHDKKAIRIFINNLLVTVPNVHILMTSRATLGTLQDVQEKILVLQELSPFFTVQLFVQRSRELKEDEIQDLLQYQPENQLLVGDMSYHNSQQVKNLAEHHLFKIFGGNPHAITLAAPLLIRMKLKELYMLLNTKEMYDVLKVDGIEDSTVASLRLSLEVSIKVLQNEDLQALQFFFLIGMLPGGIEEEELAEIWGIDYKKHLDSLMNLSLVQMKQEKNSGKVKVILPPFMSNYADAKISQEDKVLFQNDICHYYAKVCKKIYQNIGKSIKNTNGRPSELNHQVMEKLLKHETNIYACIYRMVDAKPQTKTEKDLEEEIEDEEAEQDFFANQQSQRYRRLSTLMQNIEYKNDFKKAQTLTFNNENIKDLTKLEQQIPQGPKIKHLPDIADARPFSIMTSQTPRTDQKKLFMFPMENEQKQSFSLIPPKTKVIDEEDEESDFSDFSKEDDEAQEIKTVEKKKLQLDLSFQNNQQNTLQHIIRNSNVNFYKQSNNHGLSQLMQMMKSPDIEKKSLIRRQTLGRNDFQSNFKQVQSFNKKKTKVEELHASEQLIIYYVMNLFLLHENDNAIHMINELALKAQGSTLYEANIHRVLGLIHHNKKEIELALESFKKAKKLYKQSNSQYGIALSRFAIGYIYRSKIAEFTDKVQDEITLKRSKTHLESALVLFQTLNHVIGQALCHQQLSFVNKSLNNKKESAEHAKQQQRFMIQYTKYKNKKDCPFISRVHGNEISLLSEIVLDNETKNMFPITNLTSNRRKTAKPNDNDFSDLSLPTEDTQLGHSSSVQVEPNEQMIVPQLKGQESMYVEETDFSPMTKQLPFERNDSYASIDVAQEQVQLFKDSMSIKPTHSMQNSSPNISPSTPNLITDETSVDSIQSVIQDTTTQKQNSLVIKQQSIHLSSKLKKMISTLDIVEEEDESLRPSYVITVESQRQSKLFSNQDHGTDDSSLSTEQQIPVNNFKSLSSTSLSSLNRKKSYDLNQDAHQQDQQHLLIISDQEKAQIQLNNSANKIKKTTPKKQLNTVLINPRKLL